MRPSIVLLCFSFFIALEEIHGGAIKTGTPNSPAVNGFPCIRFIHSSGSVGCRSNDRSENDASMVYISSLDDKKFFLELKEKRVLVVKEELITGEFLQDVEKYCEGLLIDTGTTLSSDIASLDAPFPQGKGTIDGKFLNKKYGTNHEWNPKGRNVLSQNLGFPIVWLKPSTSSLLVLNRSRQNDPRESIPIFGPDFRASLQFYFGKPNVNSTVCLEFRNELNEWSPKCDPIGGQSVWASTGAPLTSESRLLFVMTKMDARGPTVEQVPGANAAISGVITMLAAAEAIKKTTSSLTWTKSVIFAGFQGESFGFVGSRRFLSDLKNFECQRSVTDVQTPFSSSFCTSPMTSNLEFSRIQLDKIDFALALDQLGKVEKDTDGRVKLNLHMNPEAPDQDTVFQKMTNTPTGTSTIVLTKGTTSSLPPTSLTSFVNSDEFGREDLPSAVLSGVATEFPSSYHSPSDTALDIPALVSASQLVLESLVALGTVETLLPDSITVNETLIEALVTCFTSNWSCPTFIQTTRPFVQSQADYAEPYAFNPPAVKNPISYYTGVYGTERQPMVINASSYLKPDFDQKWNASENKLQLVPNMLETFLRSFLASVTTRFTTVACNSTSDCEVDAECLVDLEVNRTLCGTRTSYFHNAFSPGLAALDDPRRFEIVDPNMPLWTEPRWEGLKAMTYSSPGPYIGWLVLGAGVFLTGLAVFLTRVLLARLQKVKLL